MKKILNPNLAAPSVRPSWAGPAPLAGLILVLLMFGIYVLTKIPEPRNAPATPPLKSSPIPSVDYQALVTAETSKARVQSQQLMARHKDSLVGLDSKYAMRFSLAAYEASASAAEYQSILTLIGNLAWDQVKGTNEAESYLSSKIEPPINQVMTEFNRNLNSQTAKFDNDLQKITVQLAANLAAIGPGNSRPPARVVSQQTTGPEFQILLKNLGWAATGSGAFLVSDVAFNPSILRSIAKPVRAISLRMFSKQIVKVVATPAVLTATGPAAIFFGAFTLAWLTLDIYWVKADFENAVSSDLKARLYQIRTTSMVDANQYAMSSAKKVEKIQTMIATKALNNLANMQSK